LDATFNGIFRIAVSAVLLFAASSFFTTYQDKSEVLLNEFPVAAGRGGEAGQSVSKHTVLWFCFYRFPLSKFRRFFRMRKGMRIITILSLLVIAVMVMAACGGGEATPAPAAPPRGRSRPCRGD
jgi:hypothetical protein